MARQFGGRMTSNQIKRLTRDAVDELPHATDVGLVINTRTFREYVDAFDRPVTGLLSI